VYRAHDASSDATWRSGAADREGLESDWRERFQREARAVAALPPHIVTLHSVEEADGVHF
jgi:hypothetical protein